MRLLSSKVEKGVPACLVLNDVGGSARYVYINVHDDTVQSLAGTMIGGPPERGSFASKPGQVSWRRGRWTMTELPIEQWNHFQLLDEIAVRELLSSQTETWTHFYSPLGIRDQLRMVVVDEGRLVGWLGLVGDEFYDARDKRAANSVAPELVRLISEAASVEEGLFAEQAAYMVARPDGRILYASDFARRLLGDTQQRLTKYLGTVQPGVSIRPVFRGIRLTISPMRGPSGWLKLVAFDPPNYLVQESLRGLTERQRQVAELVATGATNSEIGELLGISASTVKYHLKVLQEAFKLSDRHALVRMIAGAKSANYPSG